MNRELISKALGEVEDEYIAQCMTYRGRANGHAPERNTKMGNYEQRKKPAIAGRKLFALILAACLVFALAITAYAANFLGIREMFNGPIRKLPEPAETYIQSHTEAAQEEDWSCQITESLCGTDKVMVTVQITCADKYVLVSGFNSPETDTVELLGLEGSQTISEYAAAQGKQLLMADATLRGTEGMDIFMETIDSKNVSPREMTYFVESNITGGEMPAQAVCTVYGTVAGSDKPMELKVPFSLTQVPADGEVFAPVDPDAIPGITVGSATVTQSPLGIAIRYQETEKREGALGELMMVKFDEVTQFDGGGSVMDADGNYYFQLSMGQGTVTDTLTAHYYDWDKQLVGTVVFKKK